MEHKLHSRLSVFLALISATELTVLCQQARAADAALLRLECRTVAVASASSGSAKLSFVAATGKLEVRLAEIPDEYRAAIRLALKRYADKFEAIEGEKFHPSFLDHRMARVDLAKVFNVYGNGELTATGTLLFRENAADVLRTGDADPQGKVKEWIRSQPAGDVVESSMLATASDVGRLGVTSLRSIVAAQYLYLNALPVEKRPRYLLITVHPDHSSFYQRIGFRMIFPGWKYQGLRPADTLVLDTHDAPTWAKFGEAGMRVFEIESSSSEVETTLRSWTKRTTSEAMDPRIVEELLAETRPSRVPAQAGAGLIGR